MSESKERRKNHRFGGKMLSLVLNLLRLRAGTQEKSRLKTQISGHWQAQKWELKLWVRRAE